AVVAASAIAGYICAPTRYEKTNGRITVRRANAAPRAAEAVSIIEGFPKHVRGRALWLDHDNLNTDGIYSGKLTYRDDVTPEEMAQACFNNYDPQWVTIARQGDVVVGGRN